MADNTINVRIKDRSDTEANWTSKNPVLLKGERAITDGTGKYKIGDGKNTWSALPYYEAMTSADRTKLNGIASGANKTTVDSSLSSSSTNPVQNKVVNSALAGKSNTSHTHDLSTMINTLSIGSSTPTDDDYFVSQYVGGGTTTTTYHRRPVKALLEYIKGKFAKVATSGSYNDLSNKPTIPSVGNGTITIKQAGAVKGSFTTNQSGATTIELTDNNTDTWRGIQNNLTSTSTDQSLSAAQGKWLNENKAAMTTLKGSENLNDITTPGMYSCGGGNSITNKPSNVDAFGLIVTHNANGSFYTQILHSNGGVSYRRNCNNGTWASWTEEKHTDTVYTHPSYTAKSNGLYKVTVDSKGHVSGTTAVSKADITALGIPSTNTTYSTGTASTSGLTKLYTGTGTATDGTMTQSAIKSALDGKSNNGHTHDDRYYTESEINSKLSGKANSSHTHSQYYDSSISRTANTVLAAPNGSNGTASFRKLVASDLPSHTHNYAGSSSAGGAALSSNAVNNIFGGSRQTSGNIDFTNSAYVNKVTYILATSTMTTGKPPTDGHILSFGWDTSAGWGAQMSLGSESNNHLYIRGADSKDNKTTYGDWKTILDSSNYNIYTPTKTGGGASGTWGISITGNAATATKLGTSAGSGTQPVYFSGGKPVACTYTLGKSVPSNAVFTDTNTWRPLGTGADQACAGNDSRLSNARPASDVYAWAKESTKPSYSWGEISGKPVAFSPSAHSHVVCQSAEPSGQNNGDLWFKEE